MKYIGMPMGMWMVFHKSFRKNLTEVLKYDEKESRGQKSLFVEHGFS